VIPPLVGAAVRLLLFIIIIFFDLHPGFMIAASVCDGLGGGMCALLMASFSYITSITGTRSRSRRVVIVEFFSGLAIVVSNVSVGHAIDTLGFAWTFVMLLGFIVTALCYAVFILPEVDSMSTSSADRVDFFTAKHFRQVLALYVKDDSDGSHRHWKLRFTLLILGIASALQIGSIDVQTLFMLSAPLCLTAVWIGYYYATSHFVMILTTLVVTHIFAHRVGDLILVAVGLVFGTGYMVMFGLSTNRVMLFIGKYIFCSIANVLFQLLGNNQVNHRYRSSADFTCNRVCINSEIHSILKKSYTLSDGTAYVVSVLTCNYISRSLCVVHFHGYTNVNTFGKYFFRHCHFNL